MLIKFATALRTSILPGYFKKVRRVTAGRRSIFVPAGGTIIWIVMMLIFPREDHIVAGTLFAILFWLFLIVTALWTVILAKQQKRIKAQKDLRHKLRTQSGQDPLYKDIFQIRKDEESNE